jgi:hypothetical protein
MTTIRRIPTSKIDGNDSNATDTDEIRPFGEIAVYIDTSGSDDKLTLMMFDGERTHLKSKVLAAGVVYGSDADSGDGNNRDTIKLIPDAELHRAGGDYDNDQYLIIDPTEPGHIHIRAGGSIDNSNADLFLGGENNNVRVSDTSDRVAISADAGEGGIKTWLFDGGGALTFPDTSAQTTAYVAPTTGDAIINSQDPGTFITRNGMTIGITSAGILQMTFDSVINIKGRIAINGGASTVIPAPDGATTIAVAYPISGATAEGDHVVVTIADSSFHHVYRVTAIIREQGTTPGSEFTTAYAIIEQLQ